MRIALCQMEVIYGQMQQNLLSMERMVQTAADQGAQIALLPECADLGWAHPAAGSLADPQRVQAHLMALAAKYKLYVVCGYTGKEGATLYNEAALFSPGGELMGMHRKINLLTQVEGLYAVGSTLSVLSTPLGKIGLTICADNTATSLCLAHSLARMGAQVLLSPSAWAVPPAALGAPYGREWLTPYHTLCGDYGLPVLGVSCVGPVTAGAWAGYLCIGNSIAVRPLQEDVILPYGADAVCVRTLEVTPRADQDFGTALAQRVAARHTDVNKY